MCDRKKQEMKPTQTRLELILGDITKAEVDAIVNPTDLVLSGGGSLKGLDRQIHNAGGQEVDLACKEIVKLKGGCQTGEAVITAAGNLAAKYIIHTVGPIWMDGEVGEPELLASCYQECLRIAVENEIRSIAFPAISTGNYGYPIEKAAPVALTAVKEFVEQAQQNEEEGPKHIQFFLFNEQMYICYVEVLSKFGFNLFCLIE